MTGCQADSLAAAAEAADALHAQGARNVIITLGAKGALLSEQGVKSPIPCSSSPRYHRRGRCLQRRAGGAAGLRRTAAYRGPICGGLCRRQRRKAGRVILT